MKKSIFIFLMLTALLTGCVRSNEPHIDSPPDQVAETDTIFQ